MDEANIKRLDDAMADATADEIIESLRRVSEDKYNAIRDAIRLWDELTYEEEAACDQ
jgi:hypothetical protein